MQCPSIHCLLAAHTLLLITQSLYSKNTRAAQVYKKHSRYNMKSTAEYNTNFLMSTNKLTHYFSLSLKCWLVCSFAALSLAPLLQFRLCTSRGLGVWERNRHALLSDLPTQHSQLVTGFTLKQAPRTSCIVRTRESQWRPRFPRQTCTSMRSC